MRYDWRGRWQDPFYDGMQQQLATENVGRAIEEHTCTSSQSFTLHVRVDLVYDVSCSAGRLPLGTDGRARLMFYQMAISRIVAVALCLLVFVF
jgi:hypothetical protein